MKTKLFKVLLFLISLECFTAWLGGYNFDYRSPDVASLFIAAALLNAFICFIAYVENRKHEN